MELLCELQKFNWWSVFLAIVAAITAFKGLYELFEWVVKKFGIETKAMREKREMKALLETTNSLAQQTARNLADLQKTHTKDEKDFKQNLENHIKESKEDRKALHDEMVQFSQNRINDRKQSIEIQKELSNSIKAIADRQDDRDKKISDLTSLFVEKQISDYRWEIINLADKISEGKRVSKEALRHAISTHRKYEKIIDEHGLTNGEVDISIEIINDELKRQLSENLN